MAENSSIEWTDASWTPIKARRLSTGKTGWHCERHSPGCEHCYAETFNGRMLPNGGTGLPFSRSARDDVEIFIDENVLLQPLKWKRPRRVFVCSMTDLFAAFVPDEMIDRVFAVIAECQRHTFQVLTKRAERMADYLSALWPDIIASDPLRIVAPEVKAAIREWPLPNFWAGVSVEDQRRKHRIDHLRKCPATSRFVSFEPLLEYLSTLDLSGIDWAIIGGESGTGARQCNFDWIRSIVRQCREAGAAPFVKQLGWRPVGDFGPNPPTYSLSQYQAGELVTTTELSQYKNGVWKLRTKKGNFIGDFPEDIRVREFPVTQPANRSTT